MLEKLKMLLGIEDASLDGVLSLVLETVQDQAKNYCNIKEIPTALENITVRMAADLYRSEGYGQAQRPQTAQSVTRGDVTVNYGSSAATAEITGLKSILDDYAAQLQAFRRVRW